MPIELKMPALSPTMEEGTLAKWLVKEGDTVSSGDILAEIETDKATMEFEAVDEGTIAKILIAEGTDGVKVGAPIAILAGEGEDASAAVAAPNADPVPPVKAAEPAAPGRDLEPLGDAGPRVDLHGRAARDPRRAVVVAGVGGVVVADVLQEPGEGVEAQPTGGVGVGEAHAPRRLESPPGQAVTTDLMSRDERPTWYSAAPGSSTHAPPTHD